MNGTPAANTRIRVTGPSHKARGKVGTVTAVLPNGGTARPGEGPVVAVELDKSLYLTLLVPGELEPLDTPPGGTA